MKRILFVIVVAWLVSCGRVAVAESPGPDERGVNDMSRSHPGEFAVMASGRLTVAVEGAGTSKSVVFRDRTDSPHEFRIRVEDGIATFDGESLVDNDELFAEAVAAVRSNPGDLTLASKVRINPAFQGRQKLTTLLLTLHRIKTIEMASASSLSTSGRRADMSWNCFTNAAGWGIAIAASWTAWGFECGSGVFTAACIAEVPALTTVTSVGAAQIGRSCG